jgi:ABC-type multidrug transport system permease subunit
MRRAVVVAWAALTETFREPGLLALTLLVPVFFLFITWIGYSREPRPLTRRMLVVRESSPGGAEGNAAAEAADFLSDLAALRHADGRAVFAITTAAEEAGIGQALRERTADIAVIFPNAPSGGLGYRVQGDGASLAFIAASHAFDGAYAGYTLRRSGRIRPIAVEAAGLPLPGPRSEFEEYVPGMMIFAVLMLIPLTGTFIGREIRKGNMRRYRLAGLSAASYLCGIGISQAVIAVLQALIMLASAAAFGFSLNGSAALAILVLFVVSLSSIAFGLLTACVVSSDSAAINLGSTVTMLQVFLSGSFFAIGSPELFALRGHAVTLFDFLPATRANAMLKLVLSGGASVADVAFSLSFVMALTALLFAAGVAVFSRRLRLRRGRGHEKRAARPDSPFDGPMRDRYWSS